MFDRLTAALAANYRIRREVGAGGMATVYLADDLKHGREVALKVLRPELAATMGPERFAREIQVAARLQHPHILPLHDSGEADGFLFFVMPFITGESLRARLDRETELPVADAVRIAEQVTDALAYAHTQGVVHRDIKPDNILLSGRHALVADFGVAKAVSEATGRHGLTTAGVALGTPAYMAPEQATADPLLDHRVDIYAIGVMLYEMLTGRTPFSGNSPAQLLAAHVTEAPRPLRQLREACPPALESLVMRCLAKRPADRFQTADALLQALEPLAATSGDVTPAQTRPTAAVSPVTRSGMDGPDRKRGLQVIASVGVLTVLALAGGWYATRDKAPAPEISLASLERVKITSSGWARAGALSRDGNRVAFFERRCDSDDACTTDLRVQDVGGAGSSVLVADLDFGGTLDWSPDGRWLTFNGTVAGRYGAWLVPTLGGAPRQLGCCTAVFSGEGDTLLLTTPAISGAVPVLARGTASSGNFPEQIRLTDARLSGVMMVREVRHDRMVATVLAPDRMEPVAHGLLLDRSGTVLDTLPVQAMMNTLSLPQRTATGFWLAQREDARDWRTSLTTLQHFRWDARGGVAPQPTAIVRGIPIAGGISITPDGTLMAGDGAVEYSVWAAERDAPESMAVRLRRVAQSTATVTGSITPDGRQLLIARDRPSDARVSELSVVPFDGGAERRLTALEDAFDWDIFPDGRRALVAQYGPLETRRVLLDLETGTVSAYGEPVRERPIGHEILPGGGFIYRLGASDSLGVRDVPGRPDTVFVVPAIGGLDQLPSASPDGDRAALVMWHTSIDTLAVLTLDLRTGALVRHADLRGEGSAGHVWLPSGDLLVTLWETDRTQAWWLVPTNGGTPHRLGSAPRSDGTYRFSADGLRAIYREAIVRSDIEIWRGLPAGGNP